MATPQKKGEPIKAERPGVGKSGTPVRSHVQSETSSKTVIQNRISKGETLMFVRRNDSGDEKKAIFIRITNIAFSTSGNNETVRAIKRHVSLPGSRVSTPSMPGTPRRKRAPAAKMGKRPTSSSYLNILQRNKRSSFASMVDHYAQLDDNDDKQKSKRNLSLEEEVRQIDTFFANLGKKKDMASSKVHVQEENEKVARLWKDLGYTVVKSEHRPSIFEVKSPTSPQAQSKELKDIRKSLVELKRLDTSTPKQLGSDISKTRLSPSQLSVDWPSLSTPKQESPMYSANSDVSINSRAVLKWSIAQEDSKTNNYSTQVTPEENRPTSRVRRYYDKFKGMFSKKKDPTPPKEMPTSSSKETKTLTQALYISKSNSDKTNLKGAHSPTKEELEESRHVKWSDGSLTAESSQRFFHAQEKKAAK